MGECSVKRVLSRLGCSSDGREFQETGIVLFAFVAFGVIIFVLGFVFISVVGILSTLLRAFVSPD